MSATLARADIVETGFGLSSFIDTTAASDINGVGSQDAPPNILVLNSASQSYNQTQTASAGGTGSVSVSVSTGNGTNIGLSGNGNIGLHGSASANAPGSSNATSEQASGGFDLFWNDQFNITGSGTETFQYTLTLDGNVSLTGAPALVGGPASAYGGLTLYANESYQGGPDDIVGIDGCTGFYYSSQNNCGVINAIPISIVETTTGSTVTGDLSLPSGSSIELGLYLWARTQAYNDFADSASSDILAQFKASNTGFFTLTPITPGAGFTTASGLTYAGDPDASTVPEPSYLFVMAFGITGLWAVRKRKMSPRGKAL
jgi:hypothetical protein